MHFILDHVLEFLVVNGAEEGIELMGFACDARGKVVFACVGEALLHENLRHVFDGGAAEGGAVLEGAVEDAGFAGEEFHHFANCHARGETVWVHDDVWADALVVEGHVFLLDD